MIDAEREALIEKMARAIACHDARNPKDCLASEWCEENWICYVPEATAAFAVAEAADCIDTIRTENEKLRSANNDLREALAYEQKAAMAEIEKLRAELLHWKYEVPEMTDTIIARIMWEAYAVQAGGKTFDGKPLPTWEELGEERQACWLAAASAAAAALKEIDDAAS